MKTFTKLTLGLATALFLSSCGGGGSDIFDDSSNNGNYTDYTDDYNDYNDGSNNNSGTNDLSVNNLTGYAIVGTDGSHIQFCSDGSIYSYFNSRGTHSGSYNVVYGTKIDFYDNDGGSYSIETYDGSLTIGATYSVDDVGHSITIDYFAYSNC